MPRFLYPNQLVQGETIELSPDESHHATKVLRLNDSDSVNVFDGRGTLAKGPITILSKKKVEVHLEEVLAPEKPSNISLCFGIPKPLAMEFIFKRVTELGVRSFQPLITDHGTHPKVWKSDKWERVLVEVCKQCEGNFVPVVEEPKTFLNWIATREKNDLLLCDEKTREKETVYAGTGKVDLLIGPEGGWSDHERNLILNNEGTLFSLGKNRLRAETACLAGVLLLKERIGEL